MASPSGMIPGSHDTKYELAAKSAAQARRAAVHEELRQQAIRAGAPKSPSQPSTAIISVVYSNTSPPDMVTEGKTHALARTRRGSAHMVDEYVDPVPVGQLHLYPDSPRKSPAKSPQLPTRSSPDACEAGMPNHADGYVGRAALSPKRPHLGEAPLATSPTARAGKGAALSPKDLQLLKENLATLAERVREQREAADAAQQQQQTIKQTALSITCALMAKEFELEAAQKRINELAGLVSLLADRCAQAELSMATDVAAMKQEALKSMGAAQSILPISPGQVFYGRQVISDPSLTLTAVANGLHHLATTKPEKRASLKRSMPSKKTAEPDTQLDVTSVVEFLVGTVCAWETMEPDKAASTPVTEDTEAESVRNTSTKARRPPTSSMSAFEVFQIRDAAKALTDPSASQNDSSDIETALDTDSKCIPTAPTAPPSGNAGDVHTQAPKSAARPWAARTSESISAAKPVGLQASTSGRLGAPSWIKPGNKSTTVDVPATSPSVRK